MTDPMRGTAAGVPFVALPPANRRPDAPLVIAWHLMDPPRSPAAFAAALPLRGLEAWRVYLALPMSPDRPPDGGMEAVVQAGLEDAIRRLKVPVVAGAALEFPGVLSELRGQLGLNGGQLGLLGGSDGSSVVGSVLADVAPVEGITVDAAVLVSPVARMRDAVDATAEIFGFAYPWDEDALAFADRYDFVARAGDLAAAGAPAVRVVVGGEDHAAGFVDPATELVGALAAAYGDGERVDLHVVPGMGHALAAEPGIAPAPQTAHAAQVDALATEWFTRFLG